MSITRTTCLALGASLIGSAPGIAIAKPELWLWAVLCGFIGIMLVLYGTGFIPKYVGRPILRWLRRKRPVVAILSDLTWREGLSSLAPLYDRALRYAFDLPISTAVVGMESMEQLEMNLAVAEEYQPLSDEERLQLFQEVLPPVTQNYAMEGRRLTRRKSLVKYFEC
ncbi:hypothetical protein ACFLYR_05380 [Chloroflexota bacterium]